MAILSNYDLAKFWSRTIGTAGERMATNVNLLYRRNEGGGYKAVANLTYMRETMRALEISPNLWKVWIEDKAVSPPAAIIVNLGDGDYQGWLLLDDQSMSLLSRLANDGVFDPELANDVLIDWEDKAFGLQWEQLISALPEHIMFPFMQLPPHMRYRLAWDAYVYAKRRLQLNPVTTFTKAVIAVNMLLPEWLRYAKAKFPYRRRGAVPRLVA